jgi:uncharacterized protein
MRTEMIANPLLGTPDSWLLTVILAVCWLALMLAYSPVADRLASRLASQPPKLDAFRATQRSTAALVAGIVVAWILGGFLEEILLRGMILQAVEEFLGDRMKAALAAGLAIVAAAAVAAVIHLYQGRRGALIIAQLSVLFGLLYVLSGHNLWAVILCHGMYDTIAFIRFARRKSRYADRDREQDVPRS